MRTKCAISDRSSGIAFLRSLKKCSADKEYTYWATLAHYAKTQSRTNASEIAHFVRIVCSDLNLLGLLGFLGTSRNKLFGAFGRRSLNSTVITSHQSDGGVESKPHPVPAGSPGGPDGGLCYPPGFCAGHQCITIACVSEQARHSRAQSATSQIPGSDSGLRSETAEEYCWPLPIARGT